MAAILDFWFDTKRRRSVVGPSSGQEVAIPTFTQGNIYTFRVRCLQQAPGFPAADPLYTPIANAGKTLQLAVGIKRGNASSHQVEQYTWSTNPDLADPYFYADVSFDTAQVTSLIGSADSATSFLEINLVTDGVPQTVFSQQIVIEAAVTKNTTPTVLPGQTPLFLETALALFLQRVIVGRVTWVNDTDDTKRRDTYVDTDGTFHEDPS